MKATTRRPMTTTKAMKLVRAWAEAALLSPKDINNAACYGEDDIGRAVRVLGQEKAWTIVSST